MGKAKESWSEFLGRLRAVSGCAAPFLDAFAEHLVENGYALATAKDLLRLVASLGRWLTDVGLEMQAASEGCVERFLTERRNRGLAEKSEPANLRGFLTFLRVRGSIPQAPASLPTAINLIEQSFTLYLTQERGLGTPAVTTYLDVVRHFLDGQYGDGPIDLADLSAKDIQGFLTRETIRYAPGRAKLMVTAIRSFLKWLHFCGKISARLDNAIPSVPGWRQARLPRAIAPHEVEQMLQACRRRSGVELRDFAILLLLARLGLRAHEVVVLTLDDIEWDTSALIAHGKGGRPGRLPLPHDVGAAIAAYLRTGRPHCSTRAIFIRSKAPLRDLGNSSSISAIVRRALARAGLHPPHMGAHVLRHSLACSMLEHGASLPEIGEILRHQSLDTTGIYARVDLKALTSLALPWPLPGGEK